MSRQENKAKVVRWGLLGQSAQWEMRVDVDKKLVFPEAIVITRQRPDLVLWAKDTRQVIMVELTVPWEERVEVSHHLKRDKYESLQAECVEKGWKAWVFPVEVGCRGFPAQSIWHMFRALGVTGRRRSTAVGKIGEAAERASCWLWMRRQEKEWHPQDTKARQS